MRMWVLVNHNLDVYLFKEGHLKISSMNYDADINDKFVHLTNYTLQKHNDNFEKYEEGNELSFKNFQEYLDNEFGGRINIYKDIFPKFIEIIKISTMSVCEKINKKNRSFSFVVLGYDFMIDELFNVWLIEINKNPGLAISSPIIKMLLPRLVDDCLQLTIDNIFKNEQPQQTSNVSYPVDGYDDKENMWQYIYNMDKNTIM